MEKPSIAISAADWNNPKYETAAEFLLEFLDTYDVTKMPEFTALNINVPSVDRAELKGWKVTRQSRRRYRDYFEKRKDPYGNNYYWMFGEIIEDDPGEDSDYAAVRRNYVSITPIYAFMTNQNYMPKLKEELEGGN